MLRASSRLLTALDGLGCIHAQTLSSTITASQSPCTCSSESLCGPEPCLHLCHQLQHPLLITLDFPDSSSVRFFPSHSLRGNSGSIPGALTMAPLFRAFTPSLTPHTPPRLCPHCTDEKTEAQRGQVRGGAKQGHLPPSVSAKTGGMRLQNGNPAVSP